MTDDSPVPAQFSVDVDATVADETISVSLALDADVTLELSGLTVTVEQISQPIDLHVEPTGTPMFQALLGEPTLGGARVDVDLPIMTGGGQVLHDSQSDCWVGALELKIGTMAVDAFAVFSAGPPTSFVIVLCARFPAPGIQVGFGFAVAGVGGVFGLNRATNPDALTAAVLDHSLAALLFGNGGEDDAKRIVANLPKLFPPTAGQVVVGPMFELTWADGLLTADILLLLELPDPLRISVVGRLAVDLPVDDAAVVHIEAMVAASVTPSIPEFRMVASLTGSRIAFFALTGDMFLLIRGGPEATFVFSAGGFHPAVVPPPAVPPLKRLGMVMSLSFIELRCESYLAVTTASVQLGAQVELNAHIVGLVINGQLGFDALIEWKPAFHLRVDVHAGLTVDVAGEELCGVSFDGYLEGPGPWHLNGHGEIEILWVSIPIPIDATFGFAPPLTDPTPDVGGFLIQALANPSAWTIHPPAAKRAGVILSADAAPRVAKGQVLHPDGGLQVVQHVAPLDMTIDRFGGQTVPDQSWHLGTTLDGVDDDDPEPVSDTFADGTFRTLTVDQQLSDSGFTTHAAGAQIRPDGVHAATPLHHPDPKTITDDHVIGPDQLSRFGAFSAFDSTAHIPLLAPASTVLAPAAAVTVAAEPPVVVLSGATATTFATRSAALDHLRLLSAIGQTGQLREQWEPR